jgi:hypothetical protein
LENVRFSSQCNIGVPHSQVANWCKNIIIIIIIYMYISTPWELNLTYSNALRCRIDDIGMRIHYWQYELEVLPYADWSNHSNDDKDYNGENRTAFAFGQARHNVEMMKYDPYSWWGDFICGHRLSRTLPRLSGE